MIQECIVMVFYVSTSKFVECQNILITTRKIRNISKWNDQTKVDF